MGDRDTYLIQRFAALNESGRLAHAYLLIGPTEVGKTRTAFGVAKVLNCEASPGEGFCDQCPSCRKISNGNHPDIYFVTCKPGETIKIEQIREIIARLQLKAFEAKLKVCIIKNIENMTAEAANALLKTLEEPTPGTVFLLTSACPEIVLPTIRSRCQRFYLLGGSPQKLADELKGDHALDELRAHFLSHYAEGCLSRAKRLQKDKFFDRKNEIIDHILLRADQGETYLKRNLLDKQRTKEILQVLLSWFRDLLFMKVHCDTSRLVHLDRLAVLERFKGLYSFNEINGIVGGIVKAAGLLEENLNIKIPLMLLKERLWRG